MCSCHTLLENIYAISTTVIMFSYFSSSGFHKAPTLTSSVANSIIVKKLKKINNTLNKPRALSDKSNHK